MKKRAWLTLLLLGLSAICFFPHAKADKGEETPKYLNAGCWIYKSKSTAESARAVQLTFGEEVICTEEGGTWSAILYQGNTRYILSKNLSMQTKSVKLLDVLMSPGAHTTSEKQTLGHLRYGSKLTVLGEKTDAKGVRYIHCIAEETYHQDGRVKNKNIEGYVNASYLEDSYVLATVRESTQLYAKASTASAKTPVYFGEDLKVLQKGKEWSRVQYDGKTYFVLNSKLKDKTMQITVGRSFLTDEPRYDAKTIKYLYWNDTLKVLNVYLSPNFGNFYYCRLENGMTGYVRELSATGLRHLGYVEKREASGTTALYRNPSASSALLTSVPEGAELTVAAWGESWSRVDYKGTQGYIYTSRLRVPTRVAGGAFYAASADLYAGKNAVATLAAETVKLLGSYSGRKMTYVERADGTRGYVYLPNLNRFEAPMMLNTTCWSYEKDAATSANQKEKLNFGTEVLKLAETGSMSRIRVNGEICYVMSANLSPRQYMVSKADILVSPAASGTSEAKTLGHLGFGAEVTALGEKTAADGTKYMFASIPATYNTDGSVKNTQIQGYIKMAYLQEKSAPCVATALTGLYAAPSASSQKLDFSPGEEVEMILQGGSWSRVKYQGRYYYAVTEKLVPKQMQIMAGKVSQTKAAKPGSATLHHVYWGTPVTILGSYTSSSSGKFFYCEVEGDKGFIREFSGAGLQLIGYDQKRWTDATTALYSAASGSSEVLLSIPPRSEVSVVMESGTWSRIVYDKTEGYVYSSKLKPAEYRARGSYYASSEDLYSLSHAAGELTDEKVDLLACYPSRQRALVRRENGDTVYMSREDLTDLDLSRDATPIYASVPNLKLYMAKDHSAEVIWVRYMTELLLVDTEKVTGGSWNRVLYEEQLYYLWIPDGEERVTDQKSSFQYETEDAFQAQVVDLALSFLEKPTAYGHGESRGIPNAEGVYTFDCSGFATYVVNTVMKQTSPAYHLSRDIVLLFETDTIYDKKLETEFHVTRIFDRSTPDNELTPENPFDESLLKPGDLLYFNVGEEAEDENDVAYGKPYTHVGIYLGKGEFIHATHSWGGLVCVMTIKDQWYEKIVAGLRVLPSSMEAANKTMYTTESSNVLFSPEDGSEMMRIDAEEALTLLYNNGSDLLYTRDETPKRTSNPEDCWAYVDYQGTKAYLPYSRLTDVLQVVEEDMRVTANLALFPERDSSGEKTMAYLGTEVVYRGRYSSSDWYRVLYNDTLYYFWSPEGIEGKLADEETYGLLMEGAGAALVQEYTQLRVLPETAAESLIQLKPGDEVTIIKEVSSSWVYVRFGTQCGYTLINKLQAAEKTE